MAGILHGTCGLVGFIVDGLGFLEDLGRLEHRDAGGIAHAPGSTAVCLRKLRGVVETSCYATSARLKAGLDYMRLLT